MGLPLFVAPVEPEVASKASEKTASVPRSPIRRHQTVRSGGTARSQALEARRRRLLSMPNDPTSNELELDSSLTPGELTASESIQRQAARIAEREGDLEREYLRSRIHLGRRGRGNDPNDDGPSMMPPVPETRDYYSFRRDELSRLRQRSELQRLARNPAPTPPYTDTDLEYLARNGSDSPRSRISPHGHALAIAHRQATEGEEEQSRRLENSEPRGLSGRVSLFSSERSTRPTLSDRMGPPGRISRHSLANLEMARRSARQAYSDGLGDRDRSLSPENGAVWDTLLTSITPDPQPPSAGSSFTSAAAAASSSTASAVPSASTSMTSTGPSDEQTPARDCDVSESGSNTEEEDNMNMYDLGNFIRSNGGQTWRSYAEAVLSPPDEPSGNGLTSDDITSDVELAGMRSIISRLAERDDIPNSWWASAGLSRRI